MSSDSDDHVLAQAVHDLGSALWFGGAVMGIAGVNKSGADLSQGIDRIRVAGSAWQRFQPAQFGGIAATLLAGLRLTQVGGRRLALQQGFARVGAVKAGLAVAGAGATAYAAYSGSRIARLAEEAQRRGETVEVHDASLPTDRTPAEIRTWQRRQRVTQFLVPALAGANIVCNAWLVQSYRPVATARGVLGRLLPG
ncbi:hypothetical protein SAMN06893096_102344 [Geodermatophilus pulveris]|uniref:Uncharacterized protein n=1 Tax=Geodermatophilus pulveris TaxID=1564159 RepID=A0A239CCG0_9ACTN|nr:hypothetical protein [Geodermatophilus pulveris]SNS17321.1 hypothetical protein SAMN06893096_102344 [Geodermatophilus pulveris]